jgi:ppGpp synthetase/RelA/SpoT-type nucleotidyltranferase
VTSLNWKAEYARAHSTYEDCEKDLCRFVGKTLENAGIDVFQVEGRVKTLDSIDEKIRRKSGKYANPLTDMTDLVGVRIIAHYLEDVDRIVELLSTEFEVREEHSVNKRDELAPDQFGYASNHLVVRIGGRGERSEWAKYADISAEFQVRTMSQHAWAAMHHKLGYKREADVPIPLQRKLFRLSALFEMADEQFSTIKDEIDKLSGEYSDSVKHGALDLRVNAQSMEAYVRNSPKVLEIAEVAKGLRIRYWEGDLSVLVALAKALGAKTIGQFDEKLPDGPSTRRVLTAFLSVFGPRSEGRVIEVSLGSIIATFRGLEEKQFKRIFPDSGSTGWELFEGMHRKVRSQE